jgi:pyruvate/2-oxoglutarate dehydrogenase complex dihydrolipoamide acyltransferase (E2) component
MSGKNGFSMEKFSFNRQMVAAASSVSRQNNTIHAMTEVDITRPRECMRTYKQRTGKSMSLTAYVVTCLAKVLSEHPHFNSFRRGRKLVVLEDVTVSVMIERNLQGEPTPEPVAVQAAQTKSFLEIQQEIREAQSNQDDRMGSLEGMTWIRFIPGSLLRLFVRLASRNMTLAKKYGKVAVTAVGMFGEGSSWFIPLSSATTLITVGGISKKVVMNDGVPEEREYLCLTLSFNHDIVDGAPAARFGKRLHELMQEGELLPELPVDTE